MAKLQHVTVDICAHTSALESATEQLNQAFRSAASYTFDDVADAVMDMGRALPEIDAPPTRWQRFCYWMRDFWLEPRWG